jgi:hypothetical protein
MCHLLTLLEAHPIFHISRIMVVPTVLKSGSLKILEFSGPVRACKGIALPFLYYITLLILDLLWRDVFLVCSELENTCIEEG